ncbi:DEBR0S5_12046g1_1 [Brettanomyces bruxellensis]|uniref:ATP-dependent DNA helicase PIF1 n=1 Tax=Dekkera bruxellensis TaxID=5007 RepID=A0A7D9H4X7_DEKBR|nr:DEBR0S5_12046g1_1 [Brettanomyces bruxellensis]
MSFLSRAFRSLRIMSILPNSSPAKILRPSQEVIPDSNDDCSQSDDEKKITSSDLAFTFSSDANASQSTAPKRALKTAGSGSSPSAKKTCLSPNGTSLDEVMDYLAWFVKECPQCTKQIKQTIRILQHHFGRPKQVSVPDSRGIKSSIPGLTTSFSSTSSTLVPPRANKRSVVLSAASDGVQTQIPDVAVGEGARAMEALLKEVDSSTKVGKSMPEIMKKASTQASMQASTQALTTKTTTPGMTKKASFVPGASLLPNSEMNSMNSGTFATLPAMFMRGIATSSSQNAKIELMTQKPSMWTEANEPIRKLDASGSRKKENAPSTKKVKTITLSEEQNAVIELARLGYNIFYTGSAGTGKSLLLKSLIKALRKQHSEGSVAVTASTGLAACNIGGMTLHSFAGIGLGNGDSAALLKKVKRQQRNRKRWKNLEVLIIDEISMIDGILFDKLDYIARHMKKKLEVPFGGIQLIVCGDFYQLPPVVKDREPVFAFESASWKRAIQFTIVLKKVFRQQGDKDFIRMLGEVRDGHVSEKTARKFKALERPLAERSGVIPAQLYPTRAQVNVANNAMLRRIRGHKVVFRSYDTGTMDDEGARDKLLGNFLAPKQIALKRGAQVMMVKNMDETLVNGSLGKVVDFIDPDTYSFYKRLNDSSQDVELHEIEDSLHKLEEKKAKGSTKQRELIANPDQLNDQLDDSIFSFMRNLDDGQHEIPESVRANMLAKKALLDKLFSSSKGLRMPLVRFVLSDGSTRDVLVEPETFSIEDEFERPIASRTQIPLILAWSLSIHKAQGQTLPLVKVDLKHVFEKGQAYVALSRATSRRGLEIRHFDPFKIHAHDRVVQFYKNLMDTDQAMALHKKLVAQERDAENAELMPPDALTTRMHDLQTATARADDFPDSVPDDVRSSMNVPPSIWRGIVHKERRDVAN